MNQTEPTLRPDDSGAYRQALRLIRRRTSVPLAFGGQFSGGQLVLGEFLGNRTEGLSGLHVDPGQGVGGYVVASLRPIAVNDYESARGITHHYDEPVLGEGIRAVIGAPVTVRGNARGVLYACVRSVFPLGDVAMDAVSGVARQLASEIAIRDEVDRRVRLLETAALVPPQSADLSPGDLRDLREELLGISEAIGDDALRERLRRACDRLGARLGPAGG
ncbi:MAG: GAF domain-containing protein, partial [Nocardiopsaceae bacterium]|nr:GAF domain-containing protein [Nocardiopsaceae bacterium]